MSVLEYLIQAKLPAWAAATVTAALALGMGLYAHFLGRRLKRLEHLLQTQAIVHQKQLEFVQDRHTKRLDALDTLNGLLMEFNHAVWHVRRGNAGSASEIAEYFAKARSFARGSESLLGAAMYEAVLNYTDEGRPILDASFCITEQTARALELMGLPTPQLAALRSLIGTKHPVRDGGRVITRACSNEVGSEFGRSIIERCELSGEFSEDAYERARDRFSDLKGKMLRTLPTPTMDG